MFQWKRLELLLSREFLTLETRLDFFIDISEETRPKIPIPENLVGCSYPEVMPPT
jgi:hypothetical protein